jgi:adenosylhomocysteine nucleosidase
VLLAERLAIHDFGIVAGRRFTPTASGEIPIGAPELCELPQARPEVSAAFAELERRLAGELGHPIRRGGIVTADYFLNCAETRDELRGRFGADAIDMESGALNQVAEAWDRPLYVIRTLSDLAGEESHMTYYEMALMAAHNSALCVSELLRILKGGVDAGQALP